jgi:phage head maturation protease
MTVTDEIQMSDEQQPERLVAVRRFDAKIEPGDGRTISFRIAPFGERAMSADGLGGLPKGVAYEEELMPGLYDKQLNAAHRILLNFEHQQGIAGVVGKGVELWQQTDGYHAAFRMLDNADGDKARMLAIDGVLQGASVESYWLKSVRTAAGVVQRVKAHLDAVAICREGAYPSAVMTGLRTGEMPDPIVLDETLLPIEPDPDMLARCRALGIRVPQRYQAHPAETDTSAESDTSEDGTRHSQANVDSTED